MILVVSEQLNLRFVLEHQGKFLRSVRNSSEALRILRDQLPQVKGVILDERLPSSRLVTMYCRANAPGLRVVPWRVAQRNSPFTVRYERSMVAAAIGLEPEGEQRFVYTPGAKCS